MPTCWNGDLGDTGDHISHMAYTVDGSVAGACPPGYNRRLPQIQLFVRITPYKGGTYVLSDESDKFHVDFFNGWKKGTLQNIIDNCPVIGDGNEEYNPPCNCDQFLTENDQLAETPVCDNDVRNYIINEATDVVNILPRGTCSGPSVIEKTWTADPPFNCNSPPVTPTTPSPTAPAPTPTVTPTISPISSPTVDNCAVMDVLGQTIFVPFAKACWRIQLGAGGTIERDTTDVRCSNISTWTSSNGVFSHFNGVDISKGTALFIPGANGVSGTIRFKEDPTAVVIPGLNVLSFDSGIGVFSLEITLSTCSGDAICPVMKVDV